MTASTRPVRVLVVLLISALAATACGGWGPELTIVVTGSDGLEFSGEWRVPNGGMGYEGLRLSETGTPTVFQVEKTIISLRFQKQVEDGLLRVEVRDGSHVVIRLETEAPYGVLAIGTPTASGGAEDLPAR